MRAFLLAAALLLAGCTSPDDAPADATNETGSGDAPMARAAALSLFDRSPGVGVPPTTMGIDPAVLELAVGQFVNLTVTNDGNTGHDLVIEGLDVATETIPPGGSTSVEFTPIEAGSYRMYCSIGGDGPVGHDAQGMHGEVVVS